MGQKNSKEKICGISYFACFAIFAALNPKSAHAWGHDAHQIIATVASKMVPATQSTDNAFWAANATGMGTLTNVPDQYWKGTATYTNEAPTHFFQIDSYFSDPSQFPTFPHDYATAVNKYTQATLISNGTATWRVLQFYNLAVTAFKNKDYPTGLQMAGVMSHYIEDLSQPLHVTANYDGQMTGDSGIHMFFETTNINNSNLTQLSSTVTTMAKNLLTDSTFLDDFNGDILDIVFNELDRAQAGAAEIISTDKQLGRTKQGAAAQLKLAEPRMADGAATLALILERLASDAGLSATNGATVKVSIPAWIAPQYLNVANSQKKAFYHSEVTDLIADLNGGGIANDCDQ